MKQITYEIKGVVTESMIPAITASCKILNAVEKVEIIITNSESAHLLLTISRTPDEAWEKELSYAISAHGLEIQFPALEIAEAAPENAPETSQDEPVQEPKVIPGRYVKAPRPKETRKISLTMAVSTTITAVVLAVLLTFSLTTAYIKNDLPHIVYPGQEQEEDLFAELDVIDRLFRSVTMMEDLDDEALITAVLKGYVAATGDLYAEYFTEDEFREQSDAQNGTMCGIGISVVNDVVSVNGISYQVITVANVYPDSPAEAAGVLPGDHIISVGEDETYVQSIGYTEALNRLRGEEGTECTFTVLRKLQGDSDAEYTEASITAVREKITSRSVIGRIHETDATVGILKITGFDNTTLAQFTETVEELKAKGCTYFVFDLRNNPGGLLTAVEDVLVLFLQKGDTVISTKNSAGKESVTKISVNEKGIVTCGSGQLKESDIGRYRDLKFSVLVNKFSASAAELFTANIRDYELGRIVGVKTYGKGSMQTTFSLSRYGYDGALKLTTAYYFPPCGEGYDGIGITPHVIVELSEEAEQYNINLLPDHLDNQLSAAISTMK